MTKLTFILGLCIVWSLAQSNSVRLDKTSTKVRNLNGGLKKAKYTAAAINSIVAGLKDLYDDGRQKTLVVEGVKRGGVIISCLNGQYFLTMEELRVYVKSFRGSNTAEVSGNNFEISGMNIEVEVRALYSNNGIYGEVFGSVTRFNVIATITRDGNVLEAPIPLVHVKRTAGNYICEIASASQDTVARKALETVSRFIELIAKQAYNLPVCSPPGNRFGKTVLGEVSIQGLGAQKFGDRVVASDVYHQKITAAAVSLDSAAKSLLAESLEFFVKHPTISILCVGYGRTSQAKAEIVGVKGCTSQIKLNDKKFDVKGTKITVQISSVKQDRNFSYSLGTTTVALDFTVEFTGTSVVVTPRASSGKRALLTKWPTSERTVGQCTITQDQMASVFVTVSNYLETFFGNIVKRAIDTYGQ